MSEGNEPQDPRRNPMDEGMDLAAMGLKETFQPHRWDEKRFRQELRSLIMGDKFFCGKELVDHVNEKGERIYLHAKAIDAQALMYEITFISRDRSAQSVHLDVRVDFNFVDKNGTFAATKAFTIPMEFVPKPRSTEVLQRIEEPARKTVTLLRHAVITAITGLILYVAYDVSEPDSSYEHQPTKNTSAPYIPLETTDSMHDTSVQFVPQLPLDDQWNQFWPLDPKEIPQQTYDEQLYRQYLEQQNKINPQR